MIRVKLCLALVSLTIVALLTGACESQSAAGPVPESQITVKQSGGAALLVAECRDRNFISSAADYIIEGTVKRVESKWNEEKTSIFTYSYLSIEKYVKGTPFTEDNFQIVTPGGTVGEVHQWVEDQPIFHEGRKVRVYLKEMNGEFSIVCSQFGVEEK